jgi:hypothetical protein
MGLLSEVGGRRMRLSAQDNKKNPRSYAGLAELAAKNSTRSAGVDESGRTGRSQRGEKTIDPRMVRPYHQTSV